MLRIQLKGLSKVGSQNLRHILPSSRLVIAKYTTDVSVNQPLANKIVDESANKDIVNIETQIKINPIESKIPWYLQMTNQRVDQTSMLSKESIQFPANSPESLITMSNFLKDKQGLENIIIFDVRANDSTMSKLSDFIVIATAKSVKHCQSSFIELNKLIKNEFDTAAYLEGSINPNDERKRQKRLSRRNNIGTVWKSKKRNLNINDSSESWYMVDTHKDNIFINMLTERRRNELNLEELYAPEDEKAKYVKQTVEEDIDENDEGISDENNILAGLRRLANQRRYYSTDSKKSLVVELDSLSNSLKKNDFKAAINIPELGNLKSTDSMIILKRICNTLAELDSSSQDSLNVEGWKNTFDSYWPLVLPKNCKTYWSVRLQFLQLLNVARPDIYNSSIFLEDYLEFKKYLGFETSKEDVINTLKAINSSKEIKNTMHKYSHLNEKNEVINSLLQLLVGTTNGKSIIYNEEVTYLLLKSLIKDKKTRMHSVHSIIKYITLSYGSHLTPNITVAILDILAEGKLWDELFNFWEIKIPSAGYGKDKRPWGYFIKLLVNSNDKQLMEKTIKDGHLLWLKRYGIELTEELKTDLKNLFNLVDPENMKFTRQVELFNL